MRLSWNVKISICQSALGSARDPDNSQNKGRTVDIEGLIVAKATVDGGPMFKRVQPRSRGMAYIIRKRFAHIHVTLEEL